MIINKNGLSFVATRYGEVLLTDSSLRELHAVRACLVFHLVPWGPFYNQRVLWRCMELLQQSYMSTTRGLPAACDDLHCKGCAQDLVLCHHCSGSDGSRDAGTAQGGYYLCDDNGCLEFEFCCGC